MGRVILAVFVALGALGVAVPVVTPVDAASPPPRCTYVDQQTRYGRLGDWYRSVVDTRFRISGTYAPRDLVPVSQSGAPGSGSVRRIIMPDLKAMFSAAKRAGAPFAITSAYRSYGYQVGTFARWARRSGLQAAKLASARPGHSEHQLGTSMDLTSPARVAGGRVSGVGQGPWMYADWGTTRPGAWLRNNSWRYGFVMSYPKVGSPSKTCYKYEPWHFRYVGRQIAALIHASGLTPREWLWAQGAGSSWTGGSPTASTGAGAAPPPDAAPPPATDTVDVASGTGGSSNTLALPGAIGLVAFGVMLLIGPRRSRRRRGAADRG